MLEDFTKKMIIYFIIVCSTCLLLSYMFENKNIEIAMLILSTYATILVLLILKDVKYFKIANIIEINKQEKGE